MQGGAFTLGRISTGWQFEGGSVSPFSPWLPGAMHCVDEQFDFQDGVCASSARPGSIMGQPEQAQLRAGHGGDIGQEGQGSVKTKAVSGVGRPPPGQTLTISEVWLTKFIEEKSE